MCSAGCLSRRWDRALARCIGTRPSIRESGSWGRARGPGGLWSGFLRPSGVGKHRWPGPAMKSPRRNSAGALESRTAVRKAGDGGWLLPGLSAGKGAEGSDGAHGGLGLGRSVGIACLRRTAEAGGSFLSPEGETACWFPCVRIPGDEIWGPGSRLDRGRFLRLPGDREPHRRN